MQCKSLNNIDNLSVVLVFFLFFVISLIMMYPLVLNLNISLPDAWDSIHNLWILRWIQHCYFNPFLVFNTNIMYPLQLTGTYAEMQYANALLGAPIYIITKNPITMYNCLVILSFTLSAFAVFLICNKIFRNIALAILGGVIFSFFPLKFVHLPHIQLLTCQWMLFSFYYLMKYFENKNIRNLFAFSIFFVAQGITFGYLTIMMIIMCSTYITYQFIFVIDEQMKRYGKEIAISGGVVLGIILVFYIPYIIQFLSGFVRSINDAKLYGIDLIHFVSVPENNYLYGDLLQYIRKMGFGGLPNPNLGSVFPGFVVSILVCIGIMAVFLRIYRKVVTSGRKRFEWKIIKESMRVDKSGIFLDDLCCICRIVKSIVL